MAERRHLAILRRPAVHRGRIGRLALAARRLPSTERFDGRCLARRTRRRARRRWLCL